MNRIDGVVSVVADPGEPATRPLRREFLGVVLSLVAFAAGAAEPAGPPQPDPARLFRLGEKIELKGHAFYVAKRGAGQVTLSAPLPPTASLGAFITPVAAHASNWQENAGRSPQKLIDGSGWGETWPGSGAYVHSNDVYQGGSNMWNGAPDAWLWFDLGQVHNVSGLYVWNYNEKGDWNSRSVKQFELSASADDKSFTPVGLFTLPMAPGTEDDRGQAVKFERPVKGRYFKLQIKSNYRGGEMAGLAELRFANADVQAPAPGFVWNAKYARPEHPRIPRGQPLPGGENYGFPADAGVVDVTQPPYRAQGDGVTDDTAAIQRALDDHPNQGAIIYLPNGVYLVSDTLRWPHGKGGGAEEKRTVLHGQSRAATVLQLRDACPGFEDPRHPQPVIWTGEAPAQRFGNEVQHLTVDTGANNPGACGIQFIANNQGGMYDVTIVSGDGQGVAGLDLGYTDEQGPCLIKNVRVQGFDIGVHTARGVASETLEHITVEHQNRFGFRNDGQPCTVRGLKSTNAVPAFVAAGGLSVLLDAELTGIGGASELPAVVCDAGLMARNLRTSGYRTVIEDRRGGVCSPPLAELPRTVDQFLSKPAVSLFGSSTQGLRLPIRETPELPWGDPATWVAPQKFGAQADDDGDDSGALQAAIDSGATTVYLPRGRYAIGKTILIRGRVQRILGCRAWLTVVAPLQDQAQPVFRLADESAAARPEIIELDGLQTNFASGPFVFLENTSRRTLVMRRLMINFQGARAYEGSGAGHVFIDDVVGRSFRFQGQTVWARQFNVEGDGLHVANDGGTLWILGYKTEGGGTLLATTGGGRTEVLGGFSYTVGQSLPDPMFVVKDARASFTFGEVCFTDKPFQTIVAETRDGQTKTLARDDPSWQRQLTLLTAE